ncbi:MAG: alginate lyase family protein [Pseudomonadota bacterium]
MRSAMLLGLTLLPFFGASGYASPSEAGGHVCPDIPEPVVSLAYGSRYRDDSKTRSDIDKEGDAEVTAALKPIDDFIRSLSAIADDIAAEEPDVRLDADCAGDALAAWAEAGAMTDLQTLNARLSVGGRLAGLALSYRRIRPLMADDTQVSAVDRWLKDASYNQIAFWEDDAPPGAQEGNLRAWAALGYLATGLAVGDDTLVEEAARTTEALACTANDDGSLPQEMRRAHYALHYQFHAVAPMITTAALLKRDAGIDITATCDGALGRAARFAVTDYLNEGSAAEALTGRRQSYFDGAGEIRQHELAWAHAFAAIYGDDAGLQHLTGAFRTLRNSKLGGNQALMWLQ